MHLQSIVGRRFYFNPLLFSRPFDELLSIQIILLLISPHPYYPFYLSHIFHDLMLFEKKLDGKKNKEVVSSSLPLFPSFLFLTWDHLLPIQKKRERETPKAWGVLTFVWSIVDEP